MNESMEPTTMFDLLTGTVDSPSTIPPETPCFFVPETQVPEVDTVAIVVEDEELAFGARWWPCECDLED